MKTLETDRLILRSFMLDDLDDFFEYAKNPNIGPNAGWQPHSKKEDTLKILQSFINKDEVWAIVYKENKKVIGSLGIHADTKRNNSKARQMGYVISEDYWGKGLMTEACKCAIKYVFEDINLDLLSIYHYPFNNKSKRVIEKCGFKYEGTFRKASTVYTGEVFDDVCYSILKEEYFQGIK